MTTRSDNTSHVTAAILLMTDGERPYAREAIASVYGQTVRPQQIRVYVEHANAWIDEMLREFPGVEARRIDLMPPGQVRNLAAREADSPWVAYLDGDDLWEPRKQASQLEVIEDRVALIGCDYYLMDATGRHRATAVCRHIPSASTWLARRELMLECPFRKGWTFHDDSLWWETYRGWSFTSRVPELLSAYRMKSQSRSDGTPGKRRKLQVLRMVQMPGVGPFVKLATGLMHKAHRDDRYPAPPAFR